MLKKSFPPLVAQNTQLLILGSLPGETSLKKDQYYAHPRNHFWPLLTKIFQQDFIVLSYSEKIKKMLQVGIGLWDVVSQAQRISSGDHDIRMPQHNDLQALCAQLPHLTTIAFNGIVAGKIGMRSLGSKQRYRLRQLPSSSPAYTLSFTKKLQIWEVLREDLCKKY